MATIAEFDFRLTPPVLRGAVLRILWRLATVKLLMVVALVWGVIFIVSGNLVSFVLEATIALGVYVFVGRTKGPLTTGNFHLVADDETGVTVSGGFGTSTLGWQVYKRAVVDSRYLYLYLGRTRAQATPIRGCPEVEPLIAWLRTRGLMKKA